MDLLDSDGAIRISGIGAQAQCISDPTIYLGQTFSMELYGNKVQFSISRPRGGLAAVRLGKGNSCIRFALLYFRDSDYIRSMRQYIQYDNPLRSRRLTGLSHNIQQMPRYGSVFQPQIESDEAESQVKCAPQATRSVSTSVVTPPVVPKAAA